jgi:hypothetical protein
MRYSLTSVKDKAVDSDDLIPGDTDFINEAFHVPQATKSSHQIAVAISTLAHITCSRSIDVELRFLKNVLYSRLESKIPNRCRSIDRQSHV